MSSISPGIEDQLEVTLPNWAFDTWRGLLKHSQGLLMFVTL